MCEHTVSRQGFLSDVIMKYPGKWILILRKRGGQLSCSSSVFIIHAIICRSSTGGEIVHRGPRIRGDSSWYLRTVWCGFKHSETQVSCIHLVLHTIAVGPACMSLVDALKLLNTWHTTHWTLPIVVWMRASIESHEIRTLSLFRWDP